MANTIQIGADTSGFVAGVNRARQSMEGLGGVAGQVAAGFSAFKVAEFALQTVKSAAVKFYEAIEAGGNLVDLAGQTGVAIPELMKLQLAFEQTGLGAAAVQPTLAKLQKQISEAATGSADAAAKFATIGISISDLQGLSADKQFEAVATAIQKIENPAQRAAMSMEIFGKSGAKLLATFAAGGLDDAAENLGRQAEIMAKNAGVFDRTSDVLGTAGLKLRGFFVGIAAEVVPQLTGAVDALNSLDLTSVGQSLGEGIAIAVELLERAVNKIAPFFEKSNQLAQTQSTYAGQAFMGMGGGFGGPAKAISEATKAAAEEQPVTSFFDEIRADIEKKRAAAREKYKSPEAAPSGADYIPKAGISGGGMNMIATSFAKVGALGGGAAWGVESGLSIQREQLFMQRKIADSIDSFLQKAQQPLNQYIGNVTPQLGVI